MRIAAFDDGKIGVVANDETVVDVTDLVAAVRAARARGSAARSDHPLRRARAGAGAPRRPRAAACRSPRRGCTRRSPGRRRSSA